MEASTKVRQEEAQGEGNLMTPTILLAAAVAYAVVYALFVLWPRREAGGDGANHSLEGRE